LIEQALRMPLLVLLILLFLVDLLVGADVAFHVVQLASGALLRLRQSYVCDWLWFLRWAPAASRSLIYTLKTAKLIIIIIIDF
jgi:hypothetical protein